MHIDKAGRIARRAVLLLASIGALWILAAMPANAAPYPPVPPTNGLVVPAAGAVPDPAVGSLVDPAAGSVVIAPGSFPVQARTGAPANEESGTSMVVVGVLGALAMVGLGGVVLGVRRLRPRS